MQLKLDMSCHLLNIHTKFQIDISKHVEKSPENADGQTDGQTDGRTLPRHNTSRFSNRRIKINGKYFSHIISITIPTNNAWQYKIVVSLQTAFSNLFSAMKIVSFWSNLTKICPEGSIKQQANFGSDNDLTLKRRQAIIWTDDGWICSYIHVSLSLNELTHWGRVMHICISKLTITGPDNGLLPGQCQAFIWTNVGILLTRILGTNFKNFKQFHTFSFKKMHLKMLSGKWW